VRAARLAHDDEANERDTLRRAVREAIVVMWFWIGVVVSGISYEAEDGNLRSSSFCGAGIFSLVQPLWLGSGSSKRS
jgi:hypothetical protein